MRVSLSVAAVATTLLFQSEAQADHGLVQRLAYARAVVLVHVVESSYPPPNATPNYDDRAAASTAKLLVLRSWKGPYPPGTTITAETQRICAGICIPYLFRVGQDVLVFVSDKAEPIHDSQRSVVDGVHVAETIEELDAHAAKAGT